MRVYLSGPMTGIPDFNFPAFMKAAQAWRDAGWEVCNPAESFDGKTDLPYSAYVLHDIDLLYKCQAIAVLPGWDGKGARGSVWEWGIATQIFNLPVYDAETPPRLVDPS